MNPIKIHLKQWTQHQKTWHIFLISRYATREFETTERYRETWQTNWWKIPETLIDDKESD